VEAESGGCADFPGDGEASYREVAVSFAVLGWICSIENSRTGFSSIVEGMAHWAWYLCTAGYVPWAIGERHILVWG
jgi:hypothetical protein